MYNQIKPFFYTNLSDGAFQSFFILVNFTFRESPTCFIMETLNQQNLKQRKQIIIIWILISQYN